MSRKNRNKFTKGKPDLRKEILNVFNAQPGKPLNHKQVAAAIGVSDESLRLLIQQLLTLAVEEGKLTESAPGKYLLKDQVPDVIEGTIEINRYGKGFVTVPGHDKDLEIPKGKTGLALYGDKVEISYNSKSRKSTGKVLRVVERARKEYVGIFEKNRNNYFVIPGDQRLQVEFFIRKENINGAVEGDKVVVEITNWVNPEQSPEARIVRVLGRPGEHHAEMHAIIAEYGLPYDFPKEAEKEADAIPSEITETEIAKRRDFREVVTFTIDPYDAKDFDDALSIRKLENGNYEIGVHIADVSHYVKPGTFLSLEALNRATSVYLVDRTIPMLPENISNFLCSLRPDEDKLCFAAVFEMDENAGLINEWFGRTIIRSQRRFTYEEAQEIIETGKGDLKDEVLTLDKLAKILRERRFRDGGIDFDTEEVKFKLDEQGNAIGVFVKKMKDSNRLIEDFMLLANRRVATFVGAPGKRIPPVTQPMQAKTFVYRIHDDPDPDKLTQLRTFLKNIGYKLPRPTDSESGNIIKELMAQVEGKPEESIIRQMAIRSMAKAEYSADNIGHYGLAFDYYTHFTSPIRRYPDVMVHRLLQQYLDNGKSADANEIELKCRHSSLMEKRASDAERASIKYKQVEYMLKHVGEEFDGIVSGLAGWGIYVEVDESKSEGMVSMQSLVGDHFEFDSDKYIIRGHRTGREFHMGDSIRVRIEGGDLQRRTLDFAWVGDKAAPRRGKS